MSNTKKYFIAYVLYQVGYLFCSGVITQAFLLKAGFTTHQVYLFNSFVQAIMVAVLFAMTFLSAKIKKVKMVIGISNLLLCVLVGVFFAGTFSAPTSDDSFAAVVFLIAGISYIGVGMYSVLMYTLPFNIMDMREYGKVTGLCVAWSGCITFVVSLIYSFVAVRCDYMVAMKYFFIFAFLILIASSATFMSLKETVPDEENAEKKQSVLAVFKNKNTYILMLPNFARGLAMGVMNVVAVIVISMNILIEETSGFLGVICQIAMFAGNIIYSYTYKKYSSKVLLLVSTLGCCALLPFCLSGGMIVFFIIYFFAYLFRMIIDTALPVIITEIIPKEQIGAYSSVRMLVLTGSQALAALLVFPVANAVGYVWLMVIASVMQLICGVVHYWVALKNDKAKRTVETCLQTNG